MTSVQLRCLLSTYQNGLKSSGKYLPVRCIFRNVFDSSNGRSNKFNELYRKSRYFKFTTLPKTDGFSSDRFVHVMLTVCRREWIDETIFNFPIRSQLTSKLFICGKFPWNSVRLPYSIWRRFIRWKPVKSVDGFIFRRG